MDGSGRPTRDRTEPGKVRQEAEAAEWPMTSLGLKGLKSRSSMLIPQKVSCSDFRETSPVRF